MVCVAVLFPTKFRLSTCVYGDRGDGIVAVVVVGARVEDKSSVGRRATIRVATFCLMRQYF